MINLTWQPGMTLEVIEREAILQAFRFYNKNKTATAQALGMAIRTLDSKLERYGQDDRTIDSGRNQRDADKRAFDLRRRGLDANGNFTIGKAPSSGPALEAERPKQVPRTQDADFSHETETGLRVEPAKVSSPELAVSLPVGEKVQELPFRKTANGDPRKGR